MLTLAYGMGRLFALWEMETVSGIFAMRRLYTQRTLDREDVDVLCNPRLPRHEGPLTVNVRKKQGIFQMRPLC